MIALLTMLLASMLKFWGVGFWLAIALTLVGGPLSGDRERLRSPPTCVFRLSSATLAGLSAYRGIAFMFNKGSPVFDASNRLEPLFYGHVLGIPLPFFYIIVFFAAAHWLMRHMRLGRCIYAVGGNATAARLSGINVRRVAIPGVRHRRLYGRRWRGADGSAAELWIAELRRRPRAVGDRRRGDRRGQPRRRPWRHRRDALRRAHDHHRAERPQSKRRRNLDPEYRSRRDHRDRGRLDMWREEIGAPRVLAGEDAPRQATAQQKEGDHQ